MDENLSSERDNGPKQLEVKWNGKFAYFPAGSTFLDVKEYFGWDEEVLMVQVEYDSGEMTLELMEEIEGNCEVNPLGFESEQGREALRHTASHVLAQAVKRLFPGVRLGIGPAIEDGFYYDFDTEHGFVTEDLEKIEEEMKRIVKENLPITREVLSKDEARTLFEEREEPFKLELLDEIPDDQEVSVYRQGEFVDLCAGPHVPSTGYVKVFKLLSIAGAYWRGDERKPMLQRIYGTAFMNQDDLDAHLARLEDIKRRDHRRLGRELGIFTIEEDAGPGLVFWHPNGAIIREVIENFWKEEHRKRGYDLVYTPHIAKLDIWKTSGHWDWYKDNMYSPIVVDDVEYLLKPMNCPFHILIYKSSTRSYRDLPIKYAELGTVYRYERSGVLHGMLRVRGMTQDDAHLFCRPDQLEEQIIEVLELTEFLLNMFGYYEYECMLSVRDPSNKSKYIGDDDVWEQAEGALESALKAKNLSYEIDVGEAKFYGPAIDIKTRDAVGRLWQGPTIQADFNLPERFDINYIGEDGRRYRPVVIHRTVLGTMERFIGGLIEHYAGAFPLWLAPVQVKVMPVSDKQADYASYVSQRLYDAGLRVDCDLGQDKVRYKIRQAQMQKIPYMIVVGEREKNEGTISVRHRSLGELGVMAVDQFIQGAKEEDETKALESVFAQPV
ncbi:MAG TPA: threonine--tRNA ligase [Bacillota bacterium]|nr:threonine--tRNA ligase [Bacillota bacterium]